MKKFMMMAMAAAGMLAYAGCASIETTKPNDLNGQAMATSGTNVAHYTASNFGIYFLSIPLLSGDTTNPGTIAVSKDTVNASSVINMVTAKAAKDGASKTVDLWSQNSSMMLPIPIPFLFYFRSTDVSASAIK